MEKYRKSLCTDREDLHRKCASHGDTIVNRWKKMSREKRQECLLRVDPDLHPDQWFIPSYPYTDPPMREARARRKAFLLPYLNVEVLKRNPTTLLGLLYNGTHYAPENWVPYYNRLLTLNWESGYFDVEYSSHQTLINHDICTYILRLPPSRPADLSTAFP